MKNNFNACFCLPAFRVSILMMLFLVASNRPSMAAHPPAGISFQVFYDELMPYGDWISHPVHGYVWVPYAEPGFQPYASNGYWVMSTYGNTWVSNYEWGWAPFHYGRWYFDDYLGWAWVPGYEWGPAWVNWRASGSYYGWAPLMPGVSIHVAVNIPSSYWVFVPKKRLISRNIYNYYVPRRNVVNIYNQTTIINNTYVYNNQTYISGPARREVERVTRRSVPVYQVNRSERAGRTSVSRNSIQVYQPSVRRTADNGDHQGRPSRVLSAEEHKSNLATRNSNSQGVTRTVPANSRTTGVRTSTSRTAQENAVRTSTNRNVESRSATPQRRVESGSVRTASPSQVTPAPSRTQKEMAVQPQQRNTDVRQQAPRQQANPMTPRAQSPQQRTGGQVAAPRQQEVRQPSRANTRQEVSRTANPSRVSSGASNERSSRGSARTASQSRGGTRGNN